MGNKYYIIQKHINDTSEAMLGKNIFYHCKSCNEIISSQPIESIGCECGNITIDVDYHRLVVRNYNEFETMQRKE